MHASDYEVYAYLQTGQDEAAARIVHSLPEIASRFDPKALLVGAVFALVGLALTFMLSLINVLLTFLAAGLVYVYARWTKPRGLLGNLTRGLLTMTTFLFGVAAVHPVSSLSLPIWIVAVVFFIHDTNSNIIGALRDVTGDQAAGCTTTPVRYGMHIALLISLGLTLLYLGIKGIRLGPTLPEFLTPNVAAVLVEKFGIMPIGTVEADIEAMMIGA